MATRSRPHAIALALLFLLGVVLLVVLNTWPATVGGQALLQAELTTPLSQLLAAEHHHLRTWLAIDCLFALVYTVFYTWGLRRMAAAAPSQGFAFLGRSLSWLTALAIVFDLAENAILWAGAQTAAEQVSPWLGPLVRLKFASTAVFAIYGLTWLAWRRPPAA